MNISVYKTEKVTSGSHALFALLDEALPRIPNGSIVVVAAKIVSLCEKRTVPQEGTDKDALITQESQWFLPRGNKYKVSFTITRGMLIPTAGIDESNADDQYVLWPKDPQSSANAMREHLAQKHGLPRVGVIITDSTVRPMLWGTTGIAIAYSGFNPLKNYIGTKDIFGRELKFQQSSLANGLAAAAVTLMGEGDEQTPIALIEDIPFIEFQDRNPTTEELAGLRIEPEDDVFWPLFKDAAWQKGEAE